MPSNVPAVMLKLFLCVVSADEKKNESREQWQHKWRRDIAFPDKPSFMFANIWLVSCLINIFSLFSVILLFCHSALDFGRNEASSPKPKQDELLVARKKKTRPTSPKIDIGLYGGRHKIRRRRERLVLRVPCCPLLASLSHSLFWAEIWETLNESPQLTAYR